MFTSTTNENATEWEVGVDDGWKRLHERLVELAHQRRVLEAEETDLLVEAEDSRLYRRLGHVSMHEYMEIHLGYSRHASNERLRTARELLGLPALREAYRAGELSFTAVRELTRVATPQTEDAFLEAARGKTSPEIQQLVSGRTRGDTPETPPDPALARTWLRHEVSAEVAAMWQRMRTALADELGHHLDDETLMRTVIARAIEPATTAGVSPPATQHAVTTCKRCGDAWTIDAGHDTPLTDAEAERALCDATYVGDLENAAPERPTLTIPRGLRRKVWLRAGGKCEVPGCRARRCLDLHHLKPQCEGGPHTTWNLGLICRGHHHLSHEGKLIITGRAPNIIVRWAHEEDRPRGDS